MRGKQFVVDLYKFNDFVEVVFCFDVDENLIDEVVEDNLFVVLLLKFDDFGLGVGHQVMQRV